MTTIIRGMPMSSVNVLAIQRDLKTNTRRVMNPQPKPFHDNSLIWKGDVIWQNGKLIDDEDGNSPAPYPVGTVCYIKEAIKLYEGGTIYAADGAYVPDPETQFPMRWRWKPKSLPSIYMPSAAARLWVRILEVGVERLNSITADDAAAEGVAQYDDGAFLEHETIEAYQALWEEINGEGSWFKNPWVWKYRFERIERPGV